MISKKTAVLGGGNGAHAMAAELTLKGHLVTLFELPQFKGGMKKVFDTHRTWQDMYKEGHGSIGLTPICGPNDLNSRYLTEDIPFGLVPWAMLGSLLEVPMPLINGFIDMINVVHERDWRKEGLNADEMGIEGLNREQLLHYVRTGVKHQIDRDGGQNEDFGSK